MIYQIDIYECCHEVFQFMGSIKPKRKKKKWILTIPEQMYLESVSNEYLLKPNFFFRLFHQNELLIVEKLPSKKNLVVPIQISMKCSFHHP